MTDERKKELIAKAAKALTRHELEDYRNFINNYEIVSAQNDARLRTQYPF